ncbi:serine/threonine-protein kinase VRK1-like [Anticarsia gemmatalis]|uniref:serine/threonine-protein kinase VRK1-like n=1 Tax=Anticarsia gemmatalis TaxID=129554 RepID=UPI003F7636E6
MAGKAKKAAPKKKGAGYKMPDPIPTGEVIKDTIFKKEWRIGPSIGVGGFGEIYSACDNTSKAKDYPYAIKIEPSENGPLFVENNFYSRNANKDDITQYMKSKKLSNLGMPIYYGKGTHACKGTSYRYLVLEKYGKDVWSLFNNAGKRFQPATVFQLGLQMLDVLEYIHSRGYVHADIKGANMLLGLKKGCENQVYLVDFGLATRVKEDQPFTPNPKCAHDGTIEYTSRDAHLGEPTMRGDLEILGYNMFHWLTGELPWEKVLKTATTVQNMKESFLKDVRKNITKQFADVPEALIKFFEHINALKPKAVPDYAKCRKLFEDYLKAQGVKRTNKLDFAPPKKTASKTIDNSIEEDDASDEEPIKPQKNGDAPKRRGRKPKVTVEVDTENEEPEPVKETKKKGKRKSSEPAVLVKVKKAKLNPTQTPPAKKNHTNIATQTSTEKPVRQSPRNNTSRHVSFDSPISEIVGNGKMSSSINSSGDIFDDSFTIKEVKVKPKRKLLSMKDEEVTVKRVVKKKVAGVKKTRSWKDSATIVNGRAPPS